MEDFYDSDIGAQTADILVLPSSFLKTLWKELTEGLGQIKGQEAFFRCGETVGESLAANYSGDTGRGPKRASACCSSSRRLPKGWFAKWRACLR